MSNYVTLELVSGTILIAELLNETNEGVVVLNPIRIKLVPVHDETGYHEHAVTSVYSQFTDEIDFVFDWKNIVYCKDLSSKMVAQYKKLVLAFGEERNQESESIAEEVTIDKMFKVAPGSNIH